MVAGTAGQGARAGDEAEQEGRSGRRAEPAERGRPAPRQRVRDRGRRQRQQAQRPGRGSGRPAGVSPYGLRPDPGRGVGSHTASNHEYGRPRTTTNAGSNGRRRTMAAPGSPVAGRGRNRSTVDAGGAVAEHGQRDGAADSGRVHTPTDSRGAIVTPISGQTAADVSTAPYPYPDRVGDHRRTATSANQQPAHGGGRRPV